MSNIFSMLVYADDTTLYYSIDQYGNEDVINIKLTKLSEWLGANKFALIIFVNIQIYKLLILLLNMSLNSIF